MKILHINTGQEGGAAWCARRISNALTQQGVECKMLFAEGKSMPNGINGAIAERDKFPLRSYWLFAKLRHLLMRMPWYWNVEKWNNELKKKNHKHLYLDQPLSNFTNIAHHPLVEWADIIHLHWVPNFVDYPTFFINVKKPIVWTLHDKYPAVGLQHYCSEFSPVPDNLKEIDMFCRRTKRKGVMKAKNLHIVAISEMVKKICKESDVLRGFPCTLIHNGVDVSIFKPQNVSRDSVLSKYINDLKGINADTKLFVYSAYNIWDPNKGLQRIIEALNRIKDNNKAIIAIGANNEKKIPESSFPVICTGLIKDQKELADIYSISDYFILASYEETFAQTPLEAMACGTPVIMTPCSGASDLIRPINGVICKGYDSEALTDGITKAIVKEYDSDAIRQYTIKDYGYEKIAGEYIDLYNKITSNNE